MATTQYNVDIVYDLFTIGDRAFQQHIAKQLSAVSYLRMAPSEDLKGDRLEHCFVLGCANFGDPMALQTLAKQFTEIRSPLFHKLLYSPGPQELSQPQFLFGVELGARFAFHGKTRDGELRSYLKRFVLDDRDAAHVAQLEAEFVKLEKAKDKEGLLELADKLSRENKEKEEILRLLSQINRRLGRGARVEFYLKKILEKNPQNIWAASELGRFYLRNKKAALGIEILEKLSHFNDLNGERFLELGGAYLNAGKTEEAESVLQKGAGLYLDQDERYKEQMAKAKVLQGDGKGALEILGRDEFSYEVISFLNMRAVMSMRAGQFKEGVDLYHKAVTGAGPNKVIKAKLKYNMGIGYVRQGNYEEAIACFEESITLGGKEFTRAVQPLDIVRKKLAESKPSTPDDEIDIEYESIA